MQAKQKAKKAILDSKNILSNPNPKMKFQIGNPFSQVITQGGELAGSNDITQHDHSIER